MEYAADVKLFGKLHTIFAVRGKPARFAHPVPPEGRAAIEILRELGLPMDAAEGVFINHKVYPLDHRVMPGDEVAFVPTGIPGPHRYTLGVFGAGRATAGRG